MNIMLLVAGGDIGAHSGEDLTEYLDQNVCRGCIEKLGELLK